MKSKFNEVYEKIMLVESTKSHLWQMMHGMIQTVKSIGIVTAENPRDKKLQPDENNRRNNILEKYIIDKGYGFVRIKGKYNNLENPFLIQNISRNEIMSIGQLPFVDQESVIYGDTSSPGNLKFELIDFIHNSVHIARVFRNNKLFSRNTYVSRILHGMNHMVKSVGISVNASMVENDKWRQNYLSMLPNGAFKTLTVKNSKEMYDLFIFNIKKEDFLKTVHEISPDIYGDVSDIHNITYWKYSKNNIVEWKFPDLYAEEMTKYYNDNVSSKFEIPLFNASLEEELDNFFSVYNGTKFVIPFYDDKYKDKTFVKNGTMMEDWQIARTIDIINEDVVKSLDEHYIGYKKRIAIKSGRKKLLENFGVII